MDLATKQGRKISTLQAENIALSAQVKELSAQLKWFKNQLFGQKSERRVGAAIDERQLFLGEHFAQAENGRDDESQTIAAHKRKKPKKTVGEGDGAELFFDEALVPVEEIRIADPAIKGLSADEYEIVSSKVTHHLAQRPGAYVIIKYVRDVAKIKCANKNDTKLTCAPAPVSVFEKSRADASFLAGILLDKFLYHLPLYRQHQRLKGAGINVSRAWLTQLVHQSGDLLEPIYEALLDSIREGRVKLIDETHVKAGRKEKGKMRQAFYWPILGPKGEIAFVYCQSREYFHAFDILGRNPPKGSVVVSDGYGAYKTYAEKTKTLNAQCWTHTRRGFITAEDSEPLKVKYVLKLLRKLYKNEELIRKKNLCGRRKRSYRMKHSKPVVDKIFAWIEKEMQDRDLLPSSPLSKALNYAYKRKSALEIFLDDPDVPIDTNEMERALRVIPMGRKNWLFNLVLQPGSSTGPRSARNTSASFRASSSPAACKASTPMCTWLMSCSA